MYNLIVIGYSDESWFEEGFVKLSHNRFLEYTEPHIKKEIKDNIAETLFYPCLIMKEGDNPDVYLGKVNNLVLEGNSIFISFEVIKGVSLEFSSIEPYASEFDIRDWEIYRTHWAVKDKNLCEIFTNTDFGFDRGFVEVFKDYIRKMLQTTEVEGLDDPDASKLYIDSVENKEIEKIASVTDFIRKIVNRQNSEAYINFYRGHSNSQYKLEPSLFRKTKDGSFQYLENEDTIYNELLTQNFGEFGSDNSTFDRLVRMQHFSLPTRLLDISTNLLIALYFACKGNEGLSGEVVSIQVPKNKVKYFDSDTATCIANLCKLTIKDKESLSIGELDVNYETARKKLYHFIKDDKPYFREAIEDGSINEVLCIKGKITNSRINAQSGAFLLFGLDAVLEDKNNFGFEITRYVIEGDIKKKILMELDLLNINESTLFPYLENSAKYISNKFQKI